MDRRTFLKVAAASLASPPPIQPQVKRPNETMSTNAAAPRWERISIGAVPLATASARKPPTRMIDTRLEIVIVRKSLAAANAMSAGNRTNVTRSMTMIVPAAPEAPAVSVSLVRARLRIG